MVFSNPRKSGDPSIPVNTIAKGYVYILTNKYNGTLYVGATDNLVRRITEHRLHEMEGFTSRHGLHRLVYFEMFDSVDEAFAREKAMKKWNRKWKIEAIENMNPEWNDLYNYVVETQQVDPRLHGDLL